MRCSNCGNELIPGAKFCGRCGAVAPAEAPETGASTIIVGAEEPEEPEGERPAPPASMEPATMAKAPTQSTPQAEAGANTCAVCGASLLPDARFCAKCGTVLAAADPRGTSTQPVGAPQVRTTSQPGAAQPWGQAQPPYYYAPGRDWIGETISYIPRIFRFEPGVFQQLRADATATPIAVVIAVLAMFALGAGGWLWAELELDADWELFWQSALVGTGISFGLWLVGALVTSGILSYVFQKPVRFDEVVRVTGAATAVLALGFMMFIPGISFGIGMLAIALWMAATISALQAAFDLEPREAIVAGAGGFAIWALVFPLIVSDENTLGPGVWIFESGIDLLRNLADLGYLQP